MVETQNEKEILNPLRLAHNAAQAGRRAIEKERGELTGQLKNALEQGDAAEIKRLQTRIRQIPDELLARSADEAQARRELYSTQARIHAGHAADAEKTTLALKAALLELDDEYRKARDSRVKEIDASMRLADQHRNEERAWQSRNTTGQARFLTVVEETQNGKNN